MKRMSTEAYEKEEALLRKADLRREGGGGPEPPCLKPAGLGSPEIILVSFCLSCGCISYNRMSLDSYIILKKFLCNREDWCVNKILNVKLEIIFLKDKDFREPRFTYRSNYLNNQGN